jgi:rhodanese-related sulfurtransferase
MAKHSPRFLELVKRAKAAVRETSIEDVRARLQGGQHFELVDVREDHEWQVGHLPNAVHLGRGVLERDVEQRIPDASAEIVLYCGGGYRSALAAESLQRMGYMNVWSMDGGFRAWREAGFPIESSSGSQ